MKSRRSLVVVVFAVLVLAAVLTAVESQNITPLLASNRPLVERQISCVLRRGPCDAIGQTISQLLPEALNNNCQRCTPQQAQLAQQIIAFMRAYYPRESQQIAQLYRYGR